MRAYLGFLFRCYSDPKDYWTETLRRKEKADEDRYFAEQDRRLIEQLHRQHRPAQETEPHGVAPKVPADQAPLEPAATEPSAT